MTALPGTHASAAPTCGVGADLLRVEQLTVDFASTGGRWLRVVDGIDLTVRAREIRGLVGESGSGKSVTSLAVMGLLPGGGASRVGGKVLFDGTDLLAMDRRQFRAMQGRDVAMVFQEPMTSLNPAYTVGEQIAESVRLHLGLSRAAAMRRAAELLDEVGVAHADRRVRDYPHQFSGGMRQRVMLAIALACRPRLLIADEPTTALDVTIQARILDLIRQLSHEHEMAVLFITHDFGVVAELCDEVTVMYSGQVVEAANVFDLFDAPRHPYAERLLHSIHAFDDDPDSERGLDVGDGAGGAGVPNVDPSEHGCRFAPRCTYATSVCTAGPVPLVPVGGDHVSRCVRVDELTLRGRS